MLLYERYRLAGHFFSSQFSELITKLEQLRNVPICDPIVQLSVETAALPLISWLSAQTLYPKIYWHGRDRNEDVAAIGSCKTFYFADQVDDNALAQIYQQQRNKTNHQDIRYYGGLAFDRTVECWPEFGRAHFILPRIELRRSGNHVRVLVNLNFENGEPEDEIQSALNAIAMVQKPRPLSPPNKLTLMGRSDLPNFSRWKELVEQVTQANFINSTPKVVLSRHSQIDVDDNIDPWTVLACWQGRNPNSFQFGFQFSPERAFISCSPERLYLRRQQELFTEALAGTTVRGLNPEEDNVLAQALLDDIKNSHENQLVRKHIVDVLTPLSQYVGADEQPKIFKLNHIQHLHRAIRAQLKPGVNDFELLRALHPTPAVGGLPREAALNFIRQREGYARGWYAGACGYLNHHESEFSVAIRSALIEPRRINLFAGAGIVAGSDPEAEWQELENKLATVLSILIDF
ncbi:MULTISPECIES: isochorismate synthase MenF [unclassified Shewanella]|jgi:menaquinone-specific isochorismate synthase|uniref:isochorismate synthase n=1 Tax=unclassified Shewanella TaxID=196818 RepID=UPI00137BF7CC|nr:MULTISPECIES: isochorismate synthase [unclassified Shewanella]MBO1897897.1 isochorismate synthase [Shewanella sp. BF02_Schw]QHS15256.1 isochorismate synthase [Shewanella sp. Arc9-LZ]